METLVRSGKWVPDAKDPDLMYIERENSAQELAFLRFLKSILEICPDFPLDSEIMSMECESELFRKEFLGIWILIAERNAEFLMRLGCMEKIFSWIESCSVCLWILGAKCLCVMGLNGGEMMIQNLVEIGFVEILAKCFDCECLDIVDLALAMILRLLGSLEGEKVQSRLGENSEFLKHLEDVKENHKLASLVFDRLT
jgi:hypothetical protein